jgi:hypothetical protein
MIPVEGDVKVDPVVGEFLQLGSGVIAAGQTILIVPVEAIVEPVVKVTTTSVLPLLIVN